MFEQIEEAGFGDSEACSVEIEVEERRHLE
jgi:hypothetical protein